MSTLNLPSVSKSPMMTRQEAADYLRVSRHTIDRMRDRGELRWRIISKRTVLIYRKSVEEVLYGKTQQGRGDALSASE